MGMKTMDATRRCLTILLCILSLASPAEEQAASPDYEVLKTQDGKTYENVKVLKATPSRLQIQHEYGVAAIPLSELPPEIQKKYRYDPEQAQAHERAKEEAEREAYSNAYKYLGKVISKEQFEKMYNYATDHLFTFGAGFDEITVDVRFSEVAFLLDGRVVSISGNDVLLSVDGELVYVEGLNTSAMMNDQRLRVPGLVVGIKSYVTVLGAENRVPRLVAGRSLTRAAFKKYLDGGEPLIHQSSQTTTTSSTTRCDRCGGSRLISLGRGKLGRTRCPACNGKGTKTKYDKKTSREWTEEW
ncbi:MAG: hypothetical protein RRC34_16335 [Lentisphaeria bacterium]|nr:hypothetical protein [Lentisphaeria bacterium]